MSPCQCHRGQTCLILANMKYGYESTWVRNRKYIQPNLKSEPMTSICICRYNQGLI